MVSQIVCSSSCGENDIADEVSAMFPDPMELNVEKINYPAVPETKRRYFGYMYETEDQVEFVFMPRVSS